MVQSLAGGEAEACEVGGTCPHELHCCCPFCYKRLCATHWGLSACPHLLPVPRRRLTTKTLPPLPPLPPPSDAPEGDEDREVVPPLPDDQDKPCSRPDAVVAVPAAVVAVPPCPVVAVPAAQTTPRGGWRKCEHPLCKTPNDTLLKLTGRKGGYEHLANPSLSVCGQCRRQPLPKADAELQLAVMSSPVSKDAKSKINVDCDMQPLSAAQIKLWEGDSVQSILKAYEHTAVKPMQFVAERWHMNLRIARLVLRGEVQSVVQAAVVFSALKTPRKRIGTALEMLKKSPDKIVAVANAVPQERFVGRYKEGAMTVKQKCDLVSWVRLREAANVPLVKAEIRGAMAAFCKANTGDVSATASDHMYLDWRDWVRKHVSDTGFRIGSSKKARALRQIEANALTKENAEREYDRLEALLRRRGIAVYDCHDSKLVVTDPSRIWCCDEKGFNDEVMSGKSVVVTKDNDNVTFQHSKSLKHISVLSFISGDGSAAPPAVVLSGQRWHPDWKTIWPEAITSCTKKGSFNAELFVQMVAESFVHHVRVVLKLKGSGAITAFGGLGLILE